MTGIPKELTDLPDRAGNAAPLGLLSDVLAMVRLSGALFLHSEFSEPWAYESPPSADLKELMGPESSHLILFHLIAEGSCSIRISSGQSVDVSAGEVVVLPYSDQHVVGSPPQEPPVPIESLLTPPPWSEFPVIRYGGGGDRTTIVCGYLQSSDPILDPVVRALPPIFSVRPPAGPAATWMGASIQYALDASEAGQECNPGVGLRLPELLFQEVLRLYVRNGPPELRGWLAALHDPVVGPALLELHAEPARKWTIEDLAGRIAYSRSTVNERFVRLLGRAPMTYLADLRLRLAAGLLRDTALPVAAVANEVGYESEEAFNRAFKRAMGRPPAQWRQFAAGPPASLFVAGG
jgi:AraC-like DNA-binding protein